MSKDVESVVVLGNVVVVVVKVACEASDSELGEAVAVVFSEVLDFNTPPPVHI